MRWRNAPGDGVYYDRDYNLTVYSISPVRGFDSHETRPSVVLIYLMGADMKQKCITDIKC
jgi:hypothetical protein